MSVIHIIDFRELKVQKLIIAIMFKIYFSSSQFLEYRTIIVFRKMLSNANKTLALTFVW